jgi:hypothetical protein
MERRRSVLRVFLVLALFSTVRLISADFYELRAVKFFDTFYAEWGVMNDEEYEERFNGMEFEVYCDSVLIGSFVAFQPWFGEGWAAYPDIGESILVEPFDFEVRMLPVSGYTTAFSELRLIEQSEKVLEDAGL